MQIALKDHDCLLLCTDGLTEMVDNQVIGKVLGSPQPAQAICQHLVDRALEAGGKDNVTVVVARYRLP
jgi:serine/threonine protein phosphatase PrpC